MSMKPKKTAALLLCLGCWFWGRNAMAADIADLLDAAARQPAMEIGELAARESTLAAEAATAALYPKISAFARAESYNSPTNLRPMPPTEVNVQQGDAIPFSREILRYGLTLEMPLYVHHILVLQDKMRLLAEKAAIGRRIQLCGNLAGVVAANSGLSYLGALDLAVEARLTSLAKTRDDLSLKVETGRKPEAELLKLDNSIIELRQQKNELAVKFLDLKRELERLTGMTVETPATMRLAGAIEPGTLLALDQQEKELAAAQEEERRRQAFRYPSLALTGTVSGIDGEAYNTDGHIFRDYHFAGLMLSVPLFDRTLTSDEKIAAIQAVKARKKLADLQIELTALAKNLTARAPILARSLALAEEAVKNNVELLQISRLAHELGRTTIEEYLRYEAQVLAAEAEAARIQDQQWQLIAKQAVLYGIDLRGMVQ